MHLIFDELLDEDGRYKLIIYELLQLSKGTMHIEYIEDKVGLSTFKVKQLLDELNTDIVEIDEVGEIQLDKKNINLKFNTKNIIYQKLRLHYFRKSIKGSMLIQIGLLSNYTLSEFSEIKFISRASVYNIRKNLNEFLNPWGLKMTSGRIEGEEKDIRSFYFQLLYYFFNNIDSIFTDSKRKELKQLAAELQIVLKHTFLPSQKTQLSILLGIQQLRVNANQFIDVDPLFKGSSELSDRLTSFFNNNATGEINYLVNFLYLNQFLPNCPETTEKKSEFLSLFVASMHAKGYELKIENRERTALNNLFLKWEYLNLSTTSFISEEQLFFFKESFPRTHEMVYQFCLAINSKGKRSIMRHERIHLYYELLFFLVSETNIDNVERIISVCVDFSGGKYYNEFISTSIRSFNYLNIRIQKKITNETDIYISDFLNNELTCQQIIWKNPPLDDDWSNFADQVVLLRRGGQ